MIADQMKQITIPLTIFFLTLLALPGWSETMDDLVERSDLYYKKFTDVPFNGNVVGQWNGKITKGKRSGIWTAYHDNGQLHHKGDHKNGKKAGIWTAYHDNGQLHYKGDYKNGKKAGIWEYFNKVGSLTAKETFWNNGQLESLTTYKNGKKDGLWKLYDNNGRLKKNKTFKNGVEIK